MYDLFDSAEGMVFRPPSEANSFILRSPLGVHITNAPFAQCIAMFNFGRDPLRNRINLYAIQPGVTLIYAEFSLPMVTL